MGGDAEVGGAGHTGGDETHSLFERSRLLVGVKVMRRQGGIWNVTQGSKGSNIKLNNYKNDLKSMDFDLFRKKA